MRDDLGLEALSVVVAHTELEDVVRMQSEIERVKRAFAVARAAFPAIRLGRVPFVMGPHAHAAMRIVVHHREPSHVASLREEHAEACRMRDLVEDRCPMALAEVGDTFMYDNRRNCAIVALTGRTTGEDTPANRLILQTVYKRPFTIRSDIGAQSEQDYPEWEQNGRSVIYLPLELCGSFKRWHKKEWLHDTAPRSRAVRSPVDEKKYAFCEHCYTHYTPNGSVCWFVKPMESGGGRCYSMCSHCRRARGGIPNRAISFWH